MKGPAAPEAAPAEPATEAAPAARAPAPAPTVPAAASGARERFVRGEEQAREDPREPVGTRQEVGSSGAQAGAPLRE